MNFRKDILPLFEQIEQPLLLMMNQAEFDPEDLKLLIKKCKKYNINFKLIKTKEWNVVDKLSKNKIQLKNLSNNEILNIIPSKTVVLCKGFNNIEGNSIKKLLDHVGCRMINKNSISGNKYENYLLFRQNNIPTPKTMLVNNKTDNVISVENDKQLKIITKEFKFPLIVKTIPGSRGVGTSMIESEKTLKSTLQTLWNLGGEVLVQEYLPIENDIRAYVVGDKFVGAVQRNKAKNDIRSNYSQGATLSQVKLDSDVIGLVEKVAKILKLEWCGVDVALVDNKPYIIEVNTSPGIISFKDVDITDDLIKYIKKEI